MTLIDPGMPKIATALDGPAHPEEFRTQVGRFGARHYFDPMPADGTWAQTDKSWPAVSTVKKAADKDWSWTSLQRCATYLHGKRNELDGMTAEEIHNRLLEVNKAGLSRAAGRGTSIHTVIEARLAGQSMLPGVVPEAEPYLPVIDLMLNELQPTLRYAEVVAINREYGYGGTLDAVVQIGDQCYLCDWKTRSGKHGAYQEEGWQAAAYQNADYWVAEVDGQATRIRPPAVDGLLIVSITAESYRLYPVDEPVAWDGFTALLQLWQEKRNNPIGKPIKLSVPRSASTATQPPSEPTSRNGGREDRLDYVRLRARELAQLGHADRLNEAWTAEQLPSIHPDSPIDPSPQLDLIDAVLREIEVDLDLWVDDTEIAQLDAWRGALPADRQAEFGAWLLEQKWNPTHRLTRSRADKVRARLTELHNAPTGAVA